jgi:hypothetical protein
MREKEVFHWFALQGLLRDSIMIFYSLLSSDTSPAFQSYILLLSECLQRNVLQDIEPFPPESASQLLKLPVSEQEPLTDRQYSQIISAVLDYLSLCTVCCRARVMVKISHNFVNRPTSIKVFYYQNKNSLSCYDAILFHSALLVFLLSGHEMAEIEQESVVRSKLVGLALYAGFHQEDNLLILEWIYNMMSESSSWHKQWSLPFDLVCINLLCFPTVLDSVDLSVAKLKLLSRIMFVKRSLSDVTTLCMRCLTRLQRMIDYGISIKFGASLYRTLYIFFFTKDDSSISEQTAKLLLTVSVLHPRFIPCTLNFLLTLNKAGKSAVPSSVLMSMLNQLNVTKEIPYLDYYLKVIQQAAEIGIPEDVLIAILLKVVKLSNVCATGNWSTGNQLLFTCQSVMIRVGKGQQFQDMDSVLMEIAQSYSDPDISDRAWFYHMLMHTLSSQKLMQVLNVDSHGSSISLSRIVEAEITGTSSTAELKETVGESVLLLSRDFGAASVSKQASQHVESSDSFTVQQYRNNFSAARMALTVNCFIEYFPQKDELLSSQCEIFALNLKFFSVEDCFYDIPDVFIPTLKNSEGQKSFQLTLCPKQPLPTSLQARATFCGLDGRVFTACLNSIAIHFSDYLVKPDIATLFTTLTLEDLFSQLWASISQHQYTGIAENSEDCGVISQFSLSLSWELAEKISSQVLSNYVVSREGDHIQLLILLPNHFHLLLKWLRGEQGIVVHVATDAWFVLEHVPQWLEYVQGLCKL